MRYRYVAICLAVLATGCMSTEPEPTIRDTGTRTDGASRTDTAESPVDIPQGCPDFETYESRADAHNASAPKNETAKNPRRCAITRGCTSDHRLTHWCRTECPDTHRCQPGGSWTPIRLGKSHDWAWVVAFECDSEYYCPADD